MTMTYESFSPFASHPSAAAPHSILVVDDEPAFCVVLSEILRSFGFVVHQAYNAKQALELLDSTTPDLILTDVMMPDIDGLSFVRRLRSEPIWSSIPTIVVSAKAEPKDIEATREAGADGCLVKPFSAQELRQTIHTFLGIDTGDELQ